METAPLKSFATWARTALIREVTARIAVVLAPTSPERVERPKAVEALEKVINGAGGGDKGKAAVADRVAYTWFNRIIALRFMDANGYTGIGVVSPQAGVETGQPEILAEAKRGNIDAAVVGTKTRDAVTGLLNGTRRSEDPQGEAYALLLVECCRYWNRAMPFMFEREGDFTELLIPANLLADDSVLNRAVKVLTAAVCQDVEVIGWLYQFYISERKDEVFAGFKKNKKAGAAEIPAATQLFTPHWIVRYLVENSLGRLWMLNRPSSRLVEQMDYYIASVDEEKDFLKITNPEELKVIDPACGSGHMLTYAFDLLYAIYEEEGYAPSDIPGLILANNLYGTEIDPRAGALAAFALTMKARARQRTFFNKQVEPNVCVLEPISFTPSELGILVTDSGDRADEEAFWNQFQNADTFGSLIRPRGELIEPLGRQIDVYEPDDGDIIGSELQKRSRRVILQSDYLKCRYHVVVANPPYMGTSNMNAMLSSWLTESYPQSKSDLMTAFMERAESLSLPLGRWGMINLPSWMFLTSFEQLRRKLLETSSFESLIHLGRGIFGSDFGTVAFVVARQSHTQGRMGTYRRLFERHVEVRLGDVIRNLFLNSTYGLFRADQSTFLKIPGAPFAYWLTSDEFRNYESGHLLGDVAQPRKGMDTGDNNTFLRLWHEVGVSRIGTSMGDSKKWYFYNKGGGYRRWYGNREYVVNWESEGASLRERLGWSRKSPTLRNVSFFGREGFTWGTVSSGGFSARYTPPGAIFDNGGCTLFSEKNLNLYGALMNSSVMDRYLEFLAPTLNFQPGDIAHVSIPVGLESLEVSTERCIKLARDDWDSKESSFDFKRPLIIGRSGSVERAVAACQVEGARRAEELRSLEVANNKLFADAYGLNDVVEVETPLERVALYCNPTHMFGVDNNRADVRVREDLMTDLVSYAVGCMFGRYSLDEPGLILADQGATVYDYLTKVPSPRFAPDEDNVIPVVEGDWFEDDIVAKFRQFLRAAFGERYFEENLRFVTESLGVKDLRDYFVKSFYKNHVQRYKKRPIYWLFSSPRGSFNALIYMHRYRPSTVSTVLNEYLREYKAKLESSLQHHERLAAGGGTPRQQAAAQKEADRLRRVLMELDEYEHDVLYPLASQQLSIDLDDGVKVNYPKFGAALKHIPGLEASDE